MVKGDRRGGGDGLVGRWRASGVRASEFERFNDELGGACSLTEDSSGLDCLRGAKELALCCGREMDE